MRMPSAKLAISGGSDVQRTTKQKELPSFIGRMRRTLKRGGGRPTKELPPTDSESIGSNNSIDLVSCHLSEEADDTRDGNGERNGERNGDRNGAKNSKYLHNGLEKTLQNGSVPHNRCEHDRYDILNRNNVDSGNSNLHNGTNDLHIGVDHRSRGVRLSPRGTPHGTSTTCIGDRENVKEGIPLSCNGLAAFEKQGARPKTGLYRKKSSPAGKNIEFGVTSVVVNVQANRNGESGRGNDVVADVQFRVGGMVKEEDSESTYNVPFMGTASMRNDISVKVTPGPGTDSNSDVTVNCSFNVHCRVSETEAVEDEECSVDGDGSRDVDESWMMQQDKVMSSSELEPLVIQMSQQPDGDLLNNPRTPHIAEVVMRDSLTDVDSDSSEKPRQTTAEFLARDTDKGQKSKSGDGSSDEVIMKEKLKQNFEEVVLLPKDSKIIDVVTTHRESMCDDEEMRFEYNLPRSVSDGAAILATYRNEDVFKERGILAPAVDRRTKPKSVYGDYAQPEGIHQDEDECPPPIPPRISMILDQETKREDWETEPTHMCLPALMNGHGRYHDDSGISASTRSKSLPRHSSLNDVSLDPSAQRRSKTAHLKNRVSQLFKAPRRKSCAFPDRPLPDVPGNKAVVQARENRRSQIQRPQSLYCPTDSRNPGQPPPPVRPFPQRSGSGLRQAPPRPGQENMVIIERSEGFPTKEELARCRGEFASSLRRISECGWYWGPMSWDDAEMRLENTPDGSFLVRDSSDDRHILSLTFRVQGSTHHTRIEHHNGKFSFWSQPTTHGSSSIVEFIEEAMRHSRNGRFLYFLRPRWPGLPPVPLQLLYPISRFQKARSLQHMCRFVIRRHVRLDHIDALPLPRRLKEYLREGQYYTPDDIKS